MTVLLALLGLVPLCLFAWVALLASDDSQSDLPWDEDSES